MDTNRILADLRAERTRIDRAITALEALDGVEARSVMVGRASHTAVASHSAEGQPVARRRISAAGRKRISEAAKKMWAERKKSAAPQRRREMSPATKRKLSQLAKARWAERKKSS